MDWIDLAQGMDQWRSLVNTLMNLRVPQNAGKFLSSCTIGSFSRRAQLHDDDDFSQSLQTISEIVHRFNHGLLLQNPFEFVRHSTIHHYIT
jgi:hypothetical protein